MGEVVDFSLPAETLDKLGLNADYSEKEESEATSGATTETSEATSEATAETSEATSEATAEVSKGISTEQETGDSNSFDFDKEIQGILAKYTDPESRQKLVKDLSNHEKFTASNTQRAQELADARKSLEREQEEFQKLTERMNAKEIREILQMEEEQLSKYDAYFADADDPYDDGRDKNVLRRIVEGFNKSNEISEQEKALLDEKVQLDVEKEVLALNKTFGKDFDLEKPTEELEKLAALAVQTGTDLITAYKLLDYESSRSGMTKLQEELKEANKQLNEYRKQKPTAGIVGGKSSARDSFGSPGSFEEATAMLKQQFGLGD